MCLPNGTSKTIVCLKSNVTASCVNVRNSYESFKPQTEFGLFQRDAVYRLFTEHFRYYQSRQFISIKVTRNFPMWEKQ